MEQAQNRTKAGRAVGYARVSTTEQDLQMQVDALHAAGVTSARLFVDKASGAKTDRPGLGKCLEFLQAGDLLLVWRLDRLGRSMVHLVGLVEELQQRGVGFRSICIANRSMKRPKRLSATFVNTVNVPGRYGDV